jgi:hypothetical protein
MNTGYCSVTRASAAAEIRRGRSREPEQLRRAQRVELGGRAGERVRVRRETGGHRLDLRGRDRTCAASSAA